MAKGSADDEGGDDDDCDGVREGRDRGRARGCLIISSLEDERGKKSIVWGGEKEREGGELKRAAGRAC